MNRIRLEEGSYRAVTDCTVALFQGNQQHEYRKVKAGDTFDVPRHVNEFGTFLVYHPDSGDIEPQVEQLDVNRSLGD